MRASNMMSQDAINAFQQASGLVAGNVTSFIKGVIILTSLLIYGYCLMATFRQDRHMDFVHLVVWVIRSVFLLSIIVGCFAI